MKRESSLLLPSWAALFGLGALTLPALAQDSTSLITTYPGDSLDPHSATEQVNDYVVDVAAFESSYGRIFGIAPIAKASMDFAPAPSFFNAQLSANAISNHTELGVPFVRSSYDFWNGPGFGPNGDPTVNNAGTPIDTSNMVGSQLGFVFAEFSSDDPASPTINFNNIIGGTFNYTADLPSRLFVSRIVAGTNSGDWSCNVAQFGLGCVDATGSASVRADNYQTADCGGFLSFTGNNYFRLDLLARNPAVVNVLNNSGAGGADAGATSWLLVNDGTTHSPPTLVPGSFTSTPILLGSNFSSQHVYGATTLTATSSHLGGAADHRGLVAYSHNNFSTIFSGSTLGTAGMLMINNGTDTLGLWGIAASGAPVSPKNLQLPAVVIDNDDGWQSDSLGTAGNLRFANYYSSTAFRGGSGQVAIGRDQAGRLLAAGQAHHPDFGSSTNHNNLIAVARTSDGSNIEWTVAAWTENNDGKTIYGSWGTTPIGKVVGESAGAGGSEGGPSLSSPMIDSVGNVYFTARVELTGQTWREGLVRALYDPTNFSYKLELLMLEGDVFFGGNSNTNYQIRYLSVNGNTGSTPSAPYSHAMNQYTYNGLDPLSLDSEAAETLGGIVVSAGIIYDNDGDGNFEPQDVVPTSVDQDYNVLLYVTAAIDCNQNGVPDDLDIADGTSSDVDGDGIPDECSMVGTMYCPGDGVPPHTPCPCVNNNNGGMGGCDWGDPSFPEGGVLTAAGSLSIGANDTLLTATGVSNNFGIFFGANNQVNGGNGNHLNDGLRCAGGGLVRLIPPTMASGNQLITPLPVQTLDGAAAAGVTRRYQYWFRTPQGPCGQQANLTNGVELVWQP